MGTEAAEVILITGATGQLGMDCVAVFSATHTVVAMSREALDITDPGAIETAMKAHHPSIVLNCAAFTQVDACETERDLAFRVNGDGPANLARACVSHAAYLIHISTDYVFDGARSVPMPYVESDSVGPTGVYGASKLAGEQAVLREAPTAAIVRTSWVYGLHGQNFLKAVLARALSAPDAPLRVVNDQHGSPTWTLRLAEQLVAIAAARPAGLLHATGEGHCTWYDFARAFFAEMQIDISMQPCTTADFPRPAARPANSLLENARLKQLNLNRMQDWRSDLQRFVAQHRESWMPS